MEQWTIAQPCEGRQASKINHGGKPFWCMFDYALRPAPESQGVVISLAADADEVSAEWFPHVQRGIEQGLGKAREHGRNWVSVAIEIRKIHAHCVDTTIRACEYYGATFVSGKLADQGKKLSES